MTIALALAGLALALSAVVVARRTESSDGVWFAVSGLVRFLIALGVVVVALFASDHVSDFLIAVFAIVVLCVIAAGALQLRRTAGEAWGLRLFTGGTRLSGLVAVLAAALVLVLVPGTIVFVSFQSFWLSTHGGGAAVALTGAFLVLIALFASALVRLVLTAVLALAAPLRPQRESLVGSSFASFWDSAEALGVVATTALCLSAIGFAIWAQNARARPSRSTSPQAPTRSLADAPEAALLTGLAPVLMLTGRDPWPPQRADAYLRNSEVVDLRGRTRMRHPRVADLVDHCRRQEKPCLLVHPRCAGGACSDASGAPVAYGRLALLRRDPRISWRMSPFRRKLVGIAQWWIFAPYDRWKAPLFLGVGSAVQEHASDWEAVTVGFSRERPLFVALTSHCGGTWRRYADVSVADRAFEGADPLGGRLHTLVAYADGSHALYFEPQAARTPDSIGCALERASGWFRAVSFAANALDVTRDRKRGLLKPVLGAEARRVLSFPAYWSASSTFTFETPLDTFRTTVGTGNNPAGPGSPAKKDLYVDPIRTIFCDARWHYDAPPDGPDGSDLPEPTC